MKQRDDGVAVASAGPYANHFHLAPDRQPCQYLTIQFLQAGCPSRRPTNSIKALKAYMLFICENHLNVWTASAQHRIHPKLKVVRHVIDSTVQP